VRPGHAHGAIGSAASVALPIALSLAFAAVLDTLAPCVARADAPHVVWIAGRHSPEVAGRARRWSRRVARAIAAAGVAVTDEPERWAHEPSGSEEARVERLSAIEDRVHEAHEARARLDQARALALLADAERMAHSVLDVPGATAWYAEVEIAIAVTAAEIGRTGLAEAALARATAVDPTRTLRGAEATPDLVASAAAIGRAIATGPRGRFDLRASAPGATVTLDGRRLGEAPLGVETSVGSHVLRVDAPGHRSWARVIDVLEGGRAAIDVVLAPEPGLEIARELRAAVDALTHDRVVVSLAALEALGRAPRALWLVEASEGAIDRAIVVACRASGCSAPIRIDAGRVESMMPRDPDRATEPLDRHTLSDARDWLDEPIPVEPPPPPPAPLWEEPWAWAIAGALVLGGVAAAVGATWPSRVSRLGVRGAVVLDGGVRA
jgi:hypothetical protein